MTTPYFNNGSSLNSRKRQIKCRMSFLCKRMNCALCVNIRRSFFIESGFEFVKAKGLNTHLIVSWRWRDSIKSGGFSTESDKWNPLVANSSALSKKMSGVKAKPYIRVLAIGEKGCPHLHFIMSESSALKVRRLCKKLWGDKVSIESLSIYDSRGLLGYFFDQNFIPTYDNPDRIKGIRLITASRPMRCGFPSQRYIEKIKANEKSLHGHELAEANWNGKESDFANGVKS